MFQNEGLYQEILYQGVYYIDSRSSQIWMNKKHRNFDQQTISKIFQATF